MTTLLALCFILSTLIVHWNAQGYIMNDCEVPGTFMELGTEALKGVTHCRLLLKNIMNFWLRG